MRTFPKMTSPVRILVLHLLAVLITVDGGLWNPRKVGNWSGWNLKNISRWRVNASRDESIRGLNNIWCAGYLCVRGGGANADEESVFPSHSSSRRRTSSDKQPRKKTKRKTRELKQSTKIDKTSAKIHRKVRQKMRRGKHKIKEKLRQTVAKTTSPSKEALRQWSLWTNHTSNKARQQFYDSIELVTQALIRSELDATISNETDHDDSIPIHDLEITHQSDLRLPNRKIFVVTTAALPWFTGTAVNPLLRSAYLCRKLKSINTAAANDGSNVCLSQNATTSNVDSRQWVTLVIPWLELEEDRLELYGPNNAFANQSEQEDYIRSWLRDEAGMPDEADPDSGLKILWYPARYHPGLKSIFGMGDTISLIPDEEADVVCLEEPEHLNWYRAPGEGWAKKFYYSVGIVHTNYVSYASSQYHGLWTAPAIALMSSAMIRAYCHKVIKLSGVLQSFAPEKETVSNVHGVRSDFLEEGKRRGTLNATDTSNEAGTQAYFIGKILWAKGLDKMLELQTFYRQVTGDYFDIDIFGNGPELKEIQRSFHGRKRAAPDVSSHGEVDANVNDSSDGDSESEPESLTDIVTKGKRKMRHSLESVEFDLPKSPHEFRRRPIPATFPGRVDHAQVKDHKIFINPSITEVLCTTTAEALAMGKFAIIPYHPSNAWFRQFPNCLMYRNKWEFAANLKWALSHDPEPLTPELAHQFSWEAATDRFIRAAAITRHEARERAKVGTTKLDERIEWFHNELGKSDALRKILGGGPVAKQMAWQKERNSDTAGTPVLLADSSGADEADGTEDDKFIGSALADAISSTLANLVPLSESDKSGKTASV